MEALANMNPTGVCELKEDELMLVDGGNSYEEFDVGDYIGKIIYQAVKAWRNTPEDVTFGHYSNYKKYRNR
jgi:hypothetical protein